MTRSMKVALPLLGLLAVATGFLVLSGRPKVKSPEVLARESQELQKSIVQELRNRIGSSMPDLRFQLISDSSERRISEFRGKVVIVNLWHTGCGPCWTEMPALQALETKFGDDIAVVTLTPELPARVKPIVEKRQATLPALSGYTRRYEWLPREVIPISLFVDRKGVIRDFAIGKRSQQQLENALAPYL